MVKNKLKMYIMGGCGCSLCTSMGGLLLTGYPYVLKWGM